MIVEPGISITVPPHLPVTPCPHWPGSKLKDQQCLICPGSLNGPADLIDPPGSMSWLVSWVGSSHLTLEFDKVECCTSPQFWLFKKTFTVL